MGFKRLKNSKRNKFLGVTLIEVLFAIIIFGIGILVIMRMITQNISWLYDIRNKDTALAIAKEGMDIVYHIRDSNLERGHFWNCGQIDLDESDACGIFFYDDSGLTQHIIEFDKDGLYTMNKLTDIEQSRIYHHEGTMYTQGGTNIEGFWFNHDSTGGEATRFSRIVEFLPVDGYEAYTGSVLHVNVRVIYGNPADPDEFVLQSIVGNIR